MVAIVTGQGSGLERSSAWILGSRGQIGSANLGRSDEGVHVNAANGNLVISRQDEFLIGVGPDASVHRTYNSQVTVGDGDNNDQWRASLNRRIVGSHTDASIVRVDWDGSETVYTGGPGNWTTTDGKGAHDKISWTGTQFIWTDGNSRITDTYDSTGKLLNTKDSDTNSLTYSYNGANLISRVTTHNGEYVDFLYGGPGGTQLLQTTTQAGGTIVRARYAYDGLNRLSTMTVDRSPTDGSVADGNVYVTTYTYDGSSKRVASIAQTDGSLLQVGYTQIGTDYRVTMLTQTVASGVTRVTGIYYDIANRVTTITDPLGGVTTMSYDAKGNLTQLVLPAPVPGAVAPTTSYTYDPTTGDVLTMTENGRTTTFTYDPSGNMTLSRDAAGNTVTRTYGAANELLTETRYLVPDPDGAGAGAPGTPVTTRYAYDSENHLRFAVNAEGEVVEHRYNGPGQRVATLVFPANSYNVSGLPPTTTLSEATLAAWVAGIADKSNVRRTDTVYDPRGAVWMMTSYSAADSAGNGLLSDYSRETYGYNQAGQLVSRITNASAASELFVYDGLGRLVGSTDMAGASTTIAFNDAASTTTVTLANGMTRASVFNKAGERISLTQSGIDIATAVTTEQYDGLGRMRMRTDPTGRRTYFLYDNASRKVADITDDGAVIEYGYDSSHRLVKTIGYVNKLSAGQIALLDDFTAGGSGGAGAGGVGGAPTGSNLVANGGFETSGAFTVLPHGRSNTNLPNWTKTNAENFEQVLSNQLGVTASEGSYWLDMDSVAGTGAVSAVGPNLLTNGGFETSGSFTALPHGRSNTNLPSWTKTNAENFEQVTSGQLGVTASEGTYWLDLDSVPGTGYVPTGPNLLTNGGFEQSGTYTEIPTGRSNTTLPGWTKVNSETFEQVYAESSTVGFMEGVYWLDLDSVPGSGGQIAGPNLIVNGSFEQSATSYTTTATGRVNGAALNIPGWVKTNSQGFEQLNSGVNGTAATDGSFYLDMESGGGAGSRMDISQTVGGLTAGQQMTLKFDFANTAGMVWAGEEYENSGALEVYWNGSLVALVGTLNTTMVTKSYTVTTVAGNNTLRFREIGITDGKGVSIDKVQLYGMVPSPNGGNMDIRQTVPGLVAGQMMQLEFQHANRTSAASGSFEVWWNSTLVATINSTGEDPVAKVYQFAAIAGNNTLRFKGTGTVDAVGASIDDVRLYATTAPAGGGNMDISQVVPNLVAGQLMRLQFDHANRTTAASGSFEVWWNDALVATVNSTGTTMLTKTYDVYAVAGNNTLRFKGLGTVDAAGASIDNVRLFATQTDVGGGNMDISQTVPNLAAGQMMQLQYDHANRTSAASGSFEVYWNGSLVTTVTNTGAAMQTKTHSVIAVAGNNVLRFKSIGTVDAAGASIDNVRLFATQSGGPGGGSPPPDPLAGMRPVAAPANDSWTWHVYDTADRLIETIDATGAATVFNYDGASRLVSTKAYANAIAAATVTGFKTTSPTSLVLPAANAATDHSSRSFYDNDGRLIATLDAAGGLVQIVYDDAGQKIRELGAAKAADSGLWASGTLAALQASVGTSVADRRTDFVYDGRGLLRFAIDATAKPTEYVYDANGQIVRTVVYAGSITPAASYSLAYIAAQLAGGLGANPANQISRIVYDAAGRAAFTIDATGAVSAFGYDIVGNVIKQTSYAILYTVAGDQSLTTMQSWAAGQAGNAANRISRSVYDAAGRIAYQVDAEGYVTEHQYDIAGRHTKEIRYAAAYGVADGVTKTSLAALIGALPANAVSILYTYDSAGRLTDVTDGVGAVTHYVLDGLGRTIDTIAAYGTGDAATVRRAYDAAGAVISQTIGFGTAAAATTGFNYDRVGNLLTLTDARGYQTVWTYDSLGRMLTTRVQVDGNSANDLLTTNEYDAFGNLVRVNDPRLNNSFLYYDSLGRAWLRIDAEGYATRTIYDAFGKVASVTRYYLRPIGTPTVATPPTIQTHAKDATTAFGYDKLGRLVSVTDAEAKDEAYTLNSFGDRTKVRNKLGAGLLPTDPTYDSFAVTYTFDKLGRVLSETSPVPAQTETGAVQATSITTKFEYDSRGNRTKLTEAFGLAEQRITNYAYDKASRLLQTTHAAIPWVADNLTTVTTEAPSDYFTYDLRGNLIRTITGKTATFGGSATHFYYDALDRKTAEVSATGTLSHWTYDGNGNVLTDKMFGDAVAIPAAPGGSPPAPVNASNYRLSSHSYDRANRLIGSTVASLRLGGFNGTSYTTSIDTVATSRQYDKGGNVVLDYDGVGYAERWFYDNLGRRVAKVDREDFLTVWTLDSEGSAEAETRYAQRVSSPPAVGASVTTLIGLAGGGNASVDRTTVFTYDRNGRRLTETRLNVAIGNVAGNGVTDASANAQIIYTYNGLGQVTSKREANTDLTNYEYDNAGRLIRVKDPAMTDHVGAVVRRTTETFYDGLGNLVRTEVNKDGGPAGEDRVTRYLYGAGGRLLKTTDAMGFERNFEYDAAGRVAMERYLRTKSDLTNVEEAIAYRYDLAGRLVTQATATKSGAVWLFGEATRIRYNTFGEITGRGLTGGPNETAVYQETFDYDAGGRMWRSTEGDGTAKLFVHNRNGAVTLVIASSGTDLAADSIDQAIARLTNNGANTIGAVAVAGVTATISVHNRRGEVAETRDPFRELSAGNLATIVSSRTFNAFGEVASETDARGHATGNLAAYTTDYSYNTIGRLVQRMAPSVSWTSHTGALANARPTETYYYDISGRLVAVRDANGNVTTRTLLAGTGHGGEEALYTHEYHEDDGVARIFYDVFRDARIVRNELLNSDSPAYNAPTDELRAYDKMGRLVTITQRGNLLSDSYLYDGLGQRTRHWNSFLAPTNIELTDYDARGRVVSTVAFGGDLTTTTYAWSGTMLTAGLGTFGGWVATTTYANGRASVEHSDMFGHMVFRSDLHPHSFTYTFDKAGRMVTQATDGETLTYVHLNSGRLGSVGNGLGNSTTYGYDIVGNLTSELTYKGYAVVQNSTAGYDALNRLTNWAEAGNATSPTATLAYEYDLTGNIRRSLSTYRRLDGAGTASGTVSTRDNWYLYDVMNRVVTEEGFLTGVDGQGQTVTGDAARGFGTIKRQVPGPLPSLNVDKGVGSDYAYDAAGRRVSMTVTKVRFEGGGFAPTAYFREHKEMYDYGVDGYLSQTRLATGAEVIGVNTPVPQASGSGAVIATFTRDAMGRVTGQTDWFTHLVSAAYSRFGIVYNAKGQVTEENVATLRGSDYFTSLIQNQYGDGAAYALGQVTQSTSTNKKNNILESTATTTNSYVWWDGAMQGSTSIFTNFVSSSVPDTNYTTTYFYGPTGQMTSVSISDGRPRTVTLTTDMAGQILRRDENDGPNANGDPHEVWYRFGGKQMGFTGNNGTVDTDYDASISARIPSTLTGAFRFGSTTPYIQSDFSQALDPINSFSQGSSGGSYTVQAGDTLQSIAMQLWGNASLWYKLAEANGMSAAGALIEGQSLFIPIGVMSNAHNADTFKPYDAGKALGDLSPTAPKTPKRNANKCGFMGQVLVALVAAAIAFVMPPIAPALGPILSGALTAAAINVATQGFAVATGIQDKFSWKGVALAAISGGVSGGLGNIGGDFGKFLNADKFVSNVVKGALSSTISQGISVATGLQKKFDWTGVAVAGLTAGVEGAVRRTLPGQASASYEAKDTSIKERRYQSFGNALASNGAGMLAEAAVRSLVTGTDFGDNIMQLLPNVIGRTLGNALAQDLFGAEDRVIVSVDQRRAVEARAVATAQAGGGNPLFHLASATTGFGVAKGGGEMLAGDAAILSFIGAVSTAGELTQAQQQAAGVSAAQTKVNLLMQELRNPATRDRYLRYYNGRPNEIVNIELTGEEYLLAVDAGIWRHLYGVTGTGSSGSSSGSSHGSSSGAPAATPPQGSTQGAYQDDADQNNPVTQAVNDAKAIFDPILNQPGGTVPDVGGDTPGNADVRRLVARIARRTFFADLGNLPNVDDSNAFEKYVFISRRSGNLAITRLMTGGQLGSTLPSSMFTSDVVAIVHTHPRGVALPQPGPGDPSSVWRSNNPTPNFIIGWRIPPTPTGSNAGSMRITEVGRLNGRTSYWTIGNNGNASNQTFVKWGGWR